MSAARPAGQVRSADRGSAVVDFVLLSVLIVLILAGLLQLALALHVRNTLVWCAGEGARVGARAGSTPERGAERTRTLISESLPGSLAVEVGAERRAEAGVATVEVRVSAALPVLAWWGPPDTVSARGRAFAEVQR